MTGKMVPLERRFWSKVDRYMPARSATLEPCWIWMRGTDRRGYGRIGLPGVGAGWDYAHRTAWKLTNGSIPAGLWVLHRCDTPRCVNPAHLFLGTHRDNMLDMREKGRSLAGERHNRAKLTAADVAVIRARVRAGETQTDVGADFGVRQSHVSSICSGRFWRT